MGARRVRKSTPGASKMSLPGVQNELPEASGDPLGPRGLPGRYKNQPRSAPGGLRGRKKIHWFWPGGLQKSSWTIFQRLEPPPGRFWPPFWEALGALGGAFWRLLAENPKTLDFEYVPRENLDFEGSGGPFSSLFHAKMVPKSVFGKKSAQVTTKININWLRDALGGAWGRKKNFGISKKPSGRISWPFFKKSTPGGRVRPVSAWGRKARPKHGSDSKQPSVGATRPECSLCGAVLCFASLCCAVLCCAMRWLCCCLALLCPA